MTKRPAFFPNFKKVGVDEDAFEFDWSLGFALSQKRKNVKALHDAIRKSCPDRHPLEISSKSDNGIGYGLSAMNLSFTDSGGQKCTVESVFQASKVFKNGGPFPDHYAQNPRDVRAFIKEQDRGELTGFEYEGIGWDLHPTRAFYDWIYLNALKDAANRNLVDGLAEFDCFTDIEFNPQKSLNCQAYAVALYRSFERAGVLEKALASKEFFLKMHPDDTLKGGVGMNKKVEREKQQEFSF